MHNKYDHATVHLAYELIQIEILTYSLASVHLSFVCNLLVQLFSVFLIFCFCTMNALYLPTLSRIYLIHSQSDRQQ